MARISRTEAEARGLLCKSHLRQERLKPAPGQTAAGEAWFRRGWAPVYDRALCVPLRPYRPATPAQAAALKEGRALVGTSPCNRCGERVDTEDLVRGICVRCWSAEASATARAWLDAAPLVLDTETTGLGDDAEVIEISVIDVHGEVLLDTLVRPSGAIPAEVSAIHGITDDDVATAPTWAEIHPRLVELVAGQLVIAYGADFDMRLIEQTASRHGLSWARPESGCAMRLYAQHNGEWSDRRSTWRWLKLGVAAEACGIDAGGAHRALADCKMTLGVIRAMSADALQNLS